VPRTFTFYLWLATLAWRGGARNLCSKEREENEKQIQARSRSSWRTVIFCFFALLPWAKEVHLHSRTEVCVYCVCRFAFSLHVCCSLHHPALTSSPSLFWKWKCQIAKEGMKEAICNRLCWVTVILETNTPVLKLPRTLVFIGVFLYPAE